MQEDGEVLRLAVSALPDARLLADDSGRIPVLTKRTDRCRAGMLEHTLGAASVTPLETIPSLRMIVRISVSQDEVVEGIAPIWVDLDGDGEREIVVTGNALGDALRDKML